MKVLKLLSIIFFILSLLSYSPIAYAAGIAPDFTLTDIDGNTFSLNDFRGMIVLLDFFATWCGPCRGEMPHLKAVQDEFRKELVVISISVDPDYDSVERLKQFRQDYNISWILARDTTNVHSLYNVSAIPTLYIVDQDGYIRFYQIGLTEEHVLAIEVGKLLPIRIFSVTVESGIFKISVESNSSVTTFSFNKPSMQIQFNVSGPSGTMGACNVTVPKSLIQGEPWSISIDGTQILEFYTSENNTHTMIQFTYTHGSTRRVTIQGTWVIPEFPTNIVITLVLIIVGFVTLRLNAKSTRREKEEQEPSLF